jgi:hypothetical protein
LTRDTTDEPAQSDPTGWLDRVIKQIPEIMKAAGGEFPVAALVIVVGLIAIGLRAPLVGLPCVGVGALLAYLGYKGNERLAEFTHAERHQELGNELRKAELASALRREELAHKERLVQLEARERIARDRNRQLELPALAAAVDASGRGKSHWTVKRGDPRRATPVPVGVDPMDYLIYRHTRSADEPPTDPSLPPIRHFVDLWEAALIPEDLALMWTRSAITSKRSFLLQGRGTASSSLKTGTCPSAWPWLSNLECRPWSCAASHYSGGPRNQR